MGISPVKGGCGTPNSQCGSSHLMGFSSVQEGCGSSHSRLSGAPGARLPNPTSPINGSQFLTLTNLGKHPRVQRCQGKRYIEICAEQEEQTRLLKRLQRSSSIIDEFPYLKCCCFIAFLWWTSLSPSTDSLGSKHTMLSNVCNIWIFRGRWFSFSGNWRQQSIEGWH